jgi:hypothetical protein
LIVNLYVIQELYLRRASRHVPTLIVNLYVIQELYLRRASRHVKQNENNIHLFP